MPDDKWVTKDDLDAKLAASNAKLRFALLVQSIVLIALVALLCKIFV